MNLNQQMEFDHVIEVRADGSVVDAPNERRYWAPSLLDDQLDSDNWTFFTTGYSGQDSYNGPIMHNSEFIGGQLADDILATPGFYVALVSEYTTDADDNEIGEDGELYVEGWAIARLKD